MMGRLTRSAFIALVLSITLAGTTLAFFWRSATLGSTSYMTTQVIAAETARCGDAAAPNTQLIWLARFRVMDLAYRNYFSHTAPDRTSIFNYLTAAKIAWSSAAEVLAWNSYPDDVSEATAWRQLRNSAGHWAIITNCSWTRFGAASFRVGARHVYAIVFDR